MTHLTTEQLQNIQAKADSTRDVIIESLEGNTEPASAVRPIMRASDDALPTFQQPAVANQVLNSTAACCKASRIRATSSADNLYSDCRKSANLTFGSGGKVPPGLPR